MYVCIYVCIYIYKYIYMPHSLVSRDTVVLRLAALSTFTMHSSHLNPPFSGNDT